MTFEGALHPGLVALIVIALVGAAIWSVTRARASWPLRALLVLLRTAAALILAIALLAPSRLLRDEILLRPHVHVIVDASQSMDITDYGNKLTRRREAVQSLRLNAQNLNTISSKGEVSRFDFGKELVDVSDWDEKAEAPLTAIGDAISLSARRMKGRPGGAIVVISDGRTNTGLDPVRMAAQARDRGIRVHTIGIGQSVTIPLRDRKITNLLCPSVAQVNAAVPIQGFVVALGEKGHTLPVQLKIDDEVVETRELVADSDRFSARVPFLYTPVKTGEKRVSIEVTPVEGEIDLTNNTMTTHMRVAQKDLRILYLEGKLRWEFTFLKRALAQIPGAHIVTRNLFAENGPPTAEELESFNVIIIGDVTASQLGKAFLESLKVQVSEREAGLLFLAGTQNLSAGAGWPETPMDELLPFEISSSGTPVERPTGIRLSPFGSDHFAVALDRDDGQNVKAWAALPKLESVARTGPRKPASTMLAETDDGMPILLSQPYGKGRVLAFLAETAWKWVLDSDASAEKYRRFWHQCVLWLAKKEKSARKLAIEMDRFLYLAGEPVEVVVRLEGSPGVPVTDAAVRLTIMGAQGRATSQPAAYYGGAYHATFSPTDAGEYRVVCEAKRDPEDFGTVEARFNLIAPSAELDQPGADLDALVAIASAGGGMYKPLSEASAVLEQVAKETTPLRIERVRRKSLWDRAWLILAFVSFLAVEWLIRKRKGLL